MFTEERNRLERYQNRTLNAECTGGIGRRCDLFERDSEDKRISIEILLDLHSHDGGDLLKRKRENWEEEEEEEEETEGREHDELNTKKKDR